jgi:excisionase family DNA binding protein
MQQDFTILTTRQVASQLNVKPATVRSWIKQGKLPAVNWWRYMVAYKDLNAFIEARIEAVRKKAGK